MTTPGDTRSKGETSRLFGSPTGERRANVLSELRACGGSATERELASRLVANRAERSGTAAAEPTEGDVRNLLYHVHLPKLADAGLLTWEPADGSVTIADDRQSTESRSRRDAETAAGADDDPGILREERRRTVVEILESEGGTVSLEALARELVRESGDEASDDAVRSATVALHHVHLPKLDQAGVLEYDAAERAIEYDERPATSPATSN